MCSVLLFAITPKRTIHDIFGCHNSAEINTERSASHKAQFNKDGFHCSCEQTEFQTGFISATLVTLPAAPIEFAKHYSLQLPEDIFTNVSEIVSLRGPPALS